MSRIIYKNLTTITVYLAVFYAAYFLQIFNVCIGKVRLQEYYHCIP